jgi:signal transduction histidine kinase
MQISALAVLLPVLVAVVALLVVWRQGAALSQARNLHAEAERLAAGRGRALSLAAQELRGIGASLAGASVPRNQDGDGEGVLAERPAQQLLRLADGLAAAAAGSGVPAIHEAPARLGPIMDAAIAVVDGQIRPGHRHWQVDGALGDITVKADRRALEGALAALLRRAASHSRDGDAIVLRWVTASETVAIVVEDEGAGAPAPDLVPDATVRAGGTRGLDLGLSLARSLAAAHGGDIRVEAAPGIGTRAWLTLPRSRLLEPA